MMGTRATFFVLVLFMVVNQMVHGRFIQMVSSDLVFDGFDEHVVGNSSVTCEPVYGFLPCTTAVAGQIFLMLLYQYLVFIGEKHISAGTEVVFRILGPGIFGASAPAILGAFPEAMLVLVSGGFGSKETAQKQVLVGMGLLAGTTVTFLTGIWASCVIVGKTDLRGSTAVDLKDTKGFSLTRSGISTDIRTSHAARIMTISVIPLIIVQLPQGFHTSSGKRLEVLISLIVAVALLLSYCLYQVFQPWIQKRKLAYVKHKYVISGILKHWQKNALRRLLKDDGEPDETSIRKLFKTIDVNGDKLLSESELRAFIIGIRFEETDVNLDDAAQKVFLDFDMSHTSDLNEDAFYIGISKWLQEAKRSAGHAIDLNLQSMDHLHLQAEQEHDLLGNRTDEVDGNEVEGVENVKRASVKAVLQLLLGITVLAAFADPLVDTIDSLSTATSIPSFFISFIVVPLATNSREAMSALISASQKKKGICSLTFSEIYGTVTVNNLLCLAVFLGLVYTRDLTLDFSAEVLIILIVCIMMGLFASFSTCFPLWTSLVAYVLYPFSLVLFYVLHYGFGWS